MTPDEYFPQQRSALVIWHLTVGDRLSTTEISRITGITWQGAWAMMWKLSEVLPLYQDGCYWALTCPPRKN